MFSTFNNGSDNGSGDKDDVDVDDDDDDCDGEEVMVLDAYRNMSINSDTI